MACAECGPIDHTEYKIKNGKLYKVYISYERCNCHPETCSHSNGVIKRVNETLVTDKEEIANVMNEILHKS